MMLSMRKLDWGRGGKVVQSFTLGRKHVRVLQRRAAKVARKNGTRNQSTSAVIRGLIETAERLGWPAA
jgi:hypothetical protein